jgi:hypothetical protein
VPSVWVTKSHVFYYPHRLHPRSENQKAAEFVKCRCLKKGWINAPWKVPLFDGHGFPRERNYKPHLKFYMKKAILFIYRMIPRMFGFGGWTTDFWAIGISRCFGGLCSVQSSIQHMYTFILISLSSYAFHCYPCAIWKCFIHLGFEKQGNSSWKFTAGNGKFLKKSQDRSVHFILISALFKLWCAHLHIRASQDD